MPILTYIQTHLDSDLSLEKLATFAGLTPFHFHRLFRQTIGETLKKYTQRLRLERAAYELKVREESILTIALNTGYQSHETFSRAFKRQFGLSPKQFRQMNGRLLQGGATEETYPQREALNHYTNNYQISAVRVQKLTSLPVAFMRNLGDYVAVDLTTYDKLIAWAQQQGFYSGNNLLLGIGHDDPSITPAEKCRFDACIQVPHAFRPEGQIGYQETPGGWYAAVTYVGPYGPVMFEAYAAIFQAIMQLRGFRLIGLPAIEIYRTTRINPDYELNETDIYLPVEKIS